MVDIPELVGKKTGVKTRVGRPVYKTNEAGEELFLKYTFYEIDK